MRLHLARYWLLLVMAVALAGCATRDMPGYQNTYQGYSIPPSLLARIQQKFAEHGLVHAAVARDSVGRVRLAGSYQNEDEVDIAFTIVQSIVGLKSTSPFWPQDVKLRRWEAEAARALSDYAAAQQSGRAGAGVKRALVIGINVFRDKAIPAIQGEDDARVVAERLARYGYRVTSLFGAQATKTAIEAAAASVERELGPQDTLFIYVSSHGDQPIPAASGGDGRKMSIVAYDTDVSGDYVNRRVNAQKTSVKDAVIQRLAQRPTKVTRVLIDTCYSGEILRDVPADSRQFILDQNGGRPERAGVSLASWAAAGGLAAKGIRYAGPPGAASESSTKFQSRPDYTFITATSEGEESYGPPDKTFRATIGQPRELKGSYFTQAFVAWLEVHNGQVAPAFDEAAMLTGRTVRDRSEGRFHQTPRMFSTLSTAEDNVIKF